jgi:PAS domain S-box-containing protein
MATARDIWSAVGFRSRTVRARLFLFALLLSLPIVASTIGLLVWLHHAQKSAATQQLAFTVHAVSLEVDDQIGQAKTRLRVLSRSESLLHDDLTAFEREARASVGPADGWILLRPLGGDPAINTRLEPGQKPPNTAILPDIDEGVRAGRIVVSAQWPTVLPAGRRISVSVPVTLMNGDRYILSQVIRSSDLTALLLSQGLPETWTATILDKDLRVFARSRGPAGLLGRAATPDLAAAAAAGLKGTMDGVSLENGDTTLAWSRSLGTGLTTVIAIPRSEIAAASQVSGIVTIVFGLLIILGSIAISRRVARGIIHPIDALIAMAEALGAQRAVPAANTGLRETNLVADAILNASTTLLDQDRRLREKAVVLATVERAEHEVEARFRFATEAGRLGVWELDLRTRQLTASTVCKENFGRDPEGPFTYPDMRDSIHPDDRDRVRAAFDDSVATGTDYEFECQIVRPGGTPRWLKVRAQVVRAADGTPSQLAGISLDITERVLTGERIRQSQRVEAVGRLTAGVAHDFNNLLQGLLGGIELAIDQVADQPEVSTNLELTLQAGQRGARLTSHLLSFARQQVLHPTALELRPLLADLSHTLMRTLGRDIAVRVEVEPDLPAVFADAAHLDSALLNLALNARDAMPGGGKLLIGAYAAHDQVVLTVADTGEGMAADVLAQACEPFYSTKGTKGSGLGLSMVQGFARQSGGELRIESALGRGSRIEIRLPIAARAAVPTATPKAQQIRGEGRVLVVDDDADVARITTAFLEDAGFDVTTASDGNTALVKLGLDLTFDALVTDYAMPGMNGADLILHAREMNPVLPALVITGYAGAEGQERLPANVVILRKPFRRVDLLHEVKSLIDSTAHPGMARLSAE